MRSWGRAISPIIGVALMVILTVLLASVLATGVLPMGNDLDTGPFDRAINPWSGTRGDLVRVSDQSAGANDVRYRVNFNIKSGSDTIGNSLNSVVLDVTTGSPDMFSPTGQADIEKIGIDKGSDGSIDQVITPDVDGWNVQNGGSKLKIGFTGSAYSASAGDSIIIIFGGVTNPADPGTYDVRAQTSGDGNWHTGTIEIIAD